MSATDAAVAWTRCGDAKPPHGKPVLWGTSGGTPTLGYYQWRQGRDTDWWAESRDSSVGAAFKMQPDHLWTHAPVVGRAADPRPVVSIVEARLAVDGPYADPREGDPSAMSEDPRPAGEADHHAQIHELTVHALAAQTEFVIMRTERDKWKAAHDNMVTINAALRSRPDLGDRTAQVQALIAAREKAEVAVAELDHNRAALEKALAEAIEALENCERHVGLLGGENAKLERARATLKASREGALAPAPAPTNLRSSPHAP